MARAPDRQRRELLVLRHAKSDWDTPAPTDFARPLAKRGRKSCPRVGEWLRARDLVPDRIVASTAARARQTARAVADAMGFDPDAIEWDERIYMAGLRPLLAVLADAVRGDPHPGLRLMLVGHNPGLEDLVEYLASAPVAIPENGKIMPTAALAHFRMPDDWEDLGRGAAELVGITRPRDLP